MAKQSDSEQLVLVAGKVHPKVKEEVVRLAKLDDRPFGAMVRRLIEIGLSVERARFAPRPSSDSNFISAAG